MDNQITDRPLSDDLAEVKREVQAEIDTNKKLRSDLAASDARLASFAEQISANADSAVREVGDYLGQYRDPRLPSPTQPLDEATAAPALPQEPPVYVAQPPLDAPADASTDNAGSGEQLGGEGEQTGSGQSE